MLREDPDYFEYVARRKKTPTIETVQKQFWFMQQADMVADFDDYYKKSIALSAIRKTICPY